MMFTINVTMTLIAPDHRSAHHGGHPGGGQFSQRYFKRQQEYLGHINGHIEEMYGGHIVIKALSRTGQHCQI